MHSYKIKNKKLYHNKNRRYRNQKRCIYHKIALFVWITKIILSRTIERYDPRKENTCKKSHSLFEIDNQKESKFIFAESQITKKLYWNLNLWWI